MQCIKGIAILLPALLASTGAAESGHPEPSPVRSGLGKVGMAYREIAAPADLEWRGAKERMLHAVAWYPAQASADEVEIALPRAAPRWVIGRAAIDARPLEAAGRHPLIVMSHGTGGLATQLGWLGLALARRGFVAVAVDHPGNNAAEPYTPEGFVLRWERARDLRVLIDGVLKDELLGAVVDPDRIGAAGFSLGGNTVLAVAGARTDLAAFRRHCLLHPQECAPPPEFSELIPQFEARARADGKVRASLARAGDSYRDPRVRAVFAIAPALGHSFTPDSLASIGVPVRIVVGDADSIAPAAANAAYCAAHIKGARLDTLPGVGHYTFLPTATSQAERSPLATDRPGIDRAAVHDQVAAMAVEFFGRTLQAPGQD